MKKILSVLLAVLMLMATLPMGAMAYADETFSVYADVDTSVVERGSTFTMDICIANNPGLIGWNVQVHFDENAFELVSITGGSIFPSSGMSYGPKKSPASATFSDFLSDRDTIGDGALYTATFKVKETAPVDTYTFVLGTKNNDLDNFCNLNYDYFNVDFNNIEIEVTNHIHEYDHACDTTCNTCGASRAVDPHPYVPSVITTPTCAAEGLMRYTCSVCGDSYTDAIPATGEHTYANAVTIAPTCVDKGLMTYTCYGCGVSYTEAIPATGEHTYESAVTLAPTCAAMGVMTYTCYGCGVSYTESIPATEVHTYESAVTLAPTCVTVGKMTYTCSVCNKSYTDTIPVDPTNHTYLADYDPNCEHCNAWRVVENVPADAPALVVDSVSARYEKTFTVAVRTRNNPGMTGFQMAVEYDTDLLTLVEWAEGDFAGLTCGPTDNMPFRLNWADFVNPDNTTDGVVVYLTFEAAPGVDPTETTIAVRYLSEEICNFDWENVCFATVDGVISLTSVAPGDVNEDGKVNIRDVGLIQQHINGWGVTLNLMAADVNGDGKVNIRDVGLMQQHINGWGVELG